MDFDIIKGRESEGAEKELLVLWNNSGHVKFDSLSNIEMG